MTSRRSFDVETLVLVLITIAIGAMAGAASFTHMHDWTMANSPAGTPEWFGWANAVVSELTPTASVLVMRRQRAHGDSIAFPAVVLGASVALSLSAQFAQATPSISGWLLAAVPALGFLAMTKLVLAHTTTNPEQTPQPEVPPVRAPVVAAVPRSVPPVVPVPEPDRTENHDDDVRPLFASWMLPQASHEPARVNGTPAVGRDA